VATAPEVHDTCRDGKTRQQARGEQISQARQRRAQQAQQHHGKRHRYGAGQETGDESCRNFELTWQSSVASRHSAALAAIQLPSATLTECRDQLCVTGSSTSAAPVNYVTELPPMKGVELICAAQVAHEAGEIRAPVLPQVIDECAALSVEREREVA